MTKEKSRKEQVMADKSNQCLYCGENYTQGQEGCCRRCWEQYQFVKPTPPNPDTMQEVHNQDRVHPTDKPDEVVEVNTADAMEDCIAMINEPKKEMERDPLKKILYELYSNGFCDGKGIITTEMALPNLDKAFNLIQEWARSKALSVVEIDEDNLHNTLHDELGTYLDGDFINRVRNAVLLMDNPIILKLKTPTPKGDHQ